MSHLLPDCLVLSGSFVGQVHAHLHLDMGSSRCRPPLRTPHDLHEGAGLYRRGRLVRPFSNASDPLLTPLSRLELESDQDLAEHALQIRREESSHREESIPHSEERREK